MGVFKAATANNLVRERLKNGSIEAVEGLRFDMLEFLYRMISFFHINQVDMTINKRTRDQLTLIVYVAIIGIKVAITTVVFFTHSHYDKE